LPSLSEADAAEMEAFLDEMLLIFPVLGVAAFEQPQADVRSQRLLYLKGRGIEARGYEATEGFVVMAGSQAAKDTVPSIQPYLVAQRSSLAERGILVMDGDGLRMSQDYTFDSPSAAAGVLLGCSVNGRVEWKDAEGRTLKHFQLSDEEEQTS
jgi:hypothetical protein